MNRRHLLLTATAACLALPRAGAALSGDSVDPAEAIRAMEAGETVFLDFYAPWCGTCRRQERVIAALKAANPAYARAIRFMVIDWDTHKSHPLIARLNIPRRSTLVIMDGTRELGRTVAGTSEREIKALLDLGLAAADA